MSHIVLRPLPLWLDPVDPHPVPHSFKSSWQQTQTLLRREVDQLQRNRWSGDTEIILQLQTSEYNLRKDGGMKADAKINGHGVVISFNSKHGPLRYATDRFVTALGTQGWQANVRAIAMALEGLRMVDRYGVSSRGEQYTGFGALPAARPMGTAMTIDEAERILKGYLDVTEGPSLVGWDVLYKRAAMQTHPDKGGDPDEFRRVKEAFDLLSAMPVATG